MKIFQNLRKLGFVSVSVDAFWCSLDGYTIVARVALPLFYIVTPLGLELRPTVLAIGMGTSYFCAILHGKFFLIGTATQRFELLGLGRPFSRQVIDLYKVHCLKSSRHHKLIGI